MVGEHLPDGREHARLVEHLHVHVVLRAQLVDGTYPGSGQGNGTPRPPGAQVVCRVDQVAEHRARRRHPARAPAVEHELTDRLALYEHRVERVPHRRQRVRDGDHRRMDPYGDPVADELRDGQELHHVAEPRRERDVHRRHPGDAFAVHVARHHLAAEGDGGEDRGLGPGIEALHVGSGVPLRVPQALGLGQRLGVGRALFGHPGEDVVRGAVDDAHHPADALACQRLAQRPDQGDPTRHRRLVEQVEACVRGRLEQLAPDVGEQLLVGGDDRFSGLEGLEDQHAGRLDAADYLHHHLDLGVGYHGLGVVREGARGQLHGPLLGDVAHCHPRHLEAYARPGGDDVGVAGQQLHQRGPHVAAPQDTDPHRCGPHQVNGTASTCAAGRLTPAPLAHRLTGRTGGGPGRSPAARPRGRGRRARRRPVGEAPCCTSRPWSGRTRR